MRRCGGFGGEDDGEGMAETGSAVASESLSGSGGRNDVGVVNGRIAEKWFVRERKWFSKTFGNNRVWKVNILFGFHNCLHHWRCSGGLDAGHPWRWITRGLGCEESFKGAKGGSA